MKFWQKKARNPALRNYIIALCLGLFGALSSASFNHTVFASNYGTGAFGGCGYEVSCASPPPPTITTTPTGLQVSINLTNGQVIPLSGYKIVITPLNGKGSSFKKADIYINGILTYTALPAETGTATWFWVPKTTGTATVKIVITDTNGTATVKQFSVTVKATKATAPAAPAKAAPVTPAAKPGVIQNIINHATHIVQHLPAPIVHTFPYLLFLLLAIDVLLLLFQAQRELREYRTLQLLLAHARELDESKKTFAELMAHYMRTPLAILLGGIDLLKLDTSLVSSSSINLTSLAARLRTNVESLVSQADTIVQQPVTSVAAPKRMTILKQRGLLLPVLLIAALWLVFEYLAARAGELSGRQVELAAQVIVFSAVGLVLYEAFRHRQLRRRDRQELDRIIAGAQTVAQARDSFMAQAVTVLGDDLKRLDQLIAEAQPSPAVQSLRNGQQRFEAVVAKFAIASRLRGMQSQNPLTTIGIHDFLHNALDGLETKAAARGIRIVRPADGSIVTQEPILLTFVVSTVLDNAISYSSDHGSIEITVQPTAANTTITVTDHGSGIAADKLPLLFQPFSKAEGAEVFTHEGMGFSLYLDKLIMTYLGGEISVASEPGKTTAVTIIVPAGQRPTLPSVRS